MSEQVTDILQQAVALHQSGRLDEAQALYERILRLDEANPNALNLLGMVHHAQGRFEHAIELITRAIAIAPRVAGFHNNLATVRLAQRRPIEAETALKQALSLQPDYVEAINNLGVSLMGQGKIDESMPLFAKAIQLRHAYPSARNNLGNALRARRMYTEAIACYRDALAIKPDHHESWSNLAIALLEMKDLSGAEDACRKAISLKPDAVSPYYTLGLTYEEQGRTEDAAEQYRAVLRMRPGMKSLQFQLASLTGEQRFDSAPPEFVASLFDNYADTFDRHLRNALAYRAPELLHEAITAAGQRGPIDIVDLGCGTGLCGPLFKPIARTLIGVDLSSRMIDQARQCGLHDELHVDELTSFLASRAKTFDLAIAADVFCYIGELRAAFMAVAHALRPSGLFAFTVEKHAGKGFILNPTRRYSHSID